MKKIKMFNGEFKNMDYESVCHSLGFVPESNFVEITNCGTITFTAGKTNEIKALLAACRRCGFVPAKSLEKIDV